MEDKQIIGLFWLRDETALRETQQKYDRLCRQIAHNILTDVQDVNECLNDSYLTLWQTIPPQRPQNLAAFLLKITRNLSLKRLAYNSAQKRSPGLLLSLDELAEALPAAANIEDEITKQQLITAINQFLRRQNEQNRALFLRRYWYFDSLPQICRQFNLTENAAAARLFRLRKSLKNFLQKEGITL
jgi:RNA polymerase sigma-70 factor (ECF subfamily)